MKFEISEQQDKNGYKKFKLVLLEIYPDDSVVNNTGTLYNGNGITWLEKCCQNNINTIKDSSVTVEFVDELKIDILGHGATGEYKDGLPMLDNATSIGHFTNAYIDTITVDGIDKRVVIGEGLLDYMRYPDCIDNLKDKLVNNNTVYGSIEIIKKSKNEEIVYLDGYKDKGRIPTEFDFSGYAILGCGTAPADYSATLLEVASLQNKKQKEDITTMDEKTLGIITDSIKATLAEMNSKSTEYEEKITELNSVIDKKEDEKCEISTRVTELEKALADLKAEQDIYWQQRDIIEKELAKLKVEKRISELNESIKDFTAEEVEYAKSEVEAFNASPLTLEINSVVSKINEGVAMNAIKDRKKKEQHIAEQNSANEINIFGDIDETQNKSDDYDIFG